MARTYSYIIPQYREKVLNRWPRAIVSVSMLSKVLRVLLRRMFVSCKTEYRGFNILGTTLEISGDHQQVIIVEILRYARIESILLDINVERKHRVFVVIVTS